MQQLNKSSGEEKTNLDAATTPGDFSSHMNFWRKSLALLKLF